MSKKLFPIVKGLLILIVANAIAHYVYTRFDLTEDRRYTLSEAAVQSVSDFENPVIVDVLLDGNLPSEFIKLKNEVKQILKEFAAENGHVKFAFVDPLEGVEQVDATVAELQALGLIPTRVTVNDNSKVSQEIIFPWAMVNYNNKTVRVNLLKNKQGATTEERVNNSVQHLEYAFADAFTKSTIQEKKRIAVLKGNGELDDLYLADFLTTIRDYYNIGAITLDSVSSNPQSTLDRLNEYDLALIAKPTEAFTDPEKYVLDQYIMNGGKSVWLVDQVAIEIDSLYNESGSTMALPRDLNLKDFFFNFGVRINPDLINDLYFTQIVLATGEGNASQYEPVPWLYNPMIRSGNDHPINNNLEALRLQFANSIDTLPNEYAKTVVFQSSPLSKTDLSPRQVSFTALNKPPQKEQYNNGNQPVAVLVEGHFKSAFTNRIKPIKLAEDLLESTAGKLLVVSDGDVIKNQLRNGRPLELGYDKWTSNYFGNKEFLVNALNYMLDDSGLINIRNKKVAIPFLDSAKIEAQKTKWQLLNIALPVVLTVIFGLGFNYFRKRKYGV